MKPLLNTLFVTTQGAYLRKNHETVEVRVEQETTLTVPFHLLSGIVCFGRVTVSPALMGACADRAIGFSFLSSNGRFMARVEGPASGNVLLRRQQYRLADDPSAALGIAMGFVFGKLANARTLLQRAAREHDDPTAQAHLEGAVAQLGTRLKTLKDPPDMDTLRGIEGEAATICFGALGSLIRKQREAFTFEKRTRRPPKDPVNALLSFLYSVLLHDAASALEAVGLDPAVGYLHADRPGRLSLALDLMEEFRPALADRLVISLINLGQVKAKGFQKMETGAVKMDEGTRKTVLTAYQKRKQDELTHPFTGTRTTVGLLLHLQARLLARTIRGDLDVYPPYLMK